MSLNESAAPPAAAQAHGLRILAILSTLMAFASISTDLYLPALPAMGTALHAGTGTIELTISGYLIGFSLGQLVWGPVGDRYGRRLPIAIGLVLFIVGSAGCAVSTSAGMMIGWRALQAVGACASVVLARAMVRDLFAGHRAAQMLSTLMTVMAVAPLLGPSVGGLILHVASWRAIFWTLAGVGVATLAALCGLPETLPPPQRSREPLRRALVRYGELLRHRRLLGYAGAGGFFYGGIYAYIAGTPFAYITYHHLSPQVYGLLFGAGIVGIMVTNQVNARLVARFGGDRLMRAGTVGAALAGGLLALTAWTGWAAWRAWWCRCSCSFPPPASSSPTQSPGRWAALRNARARCPRWSARCSTAAASSGRRWSAPSPTARRGRWAASSRWRGWAVCCARGWWPRPSLPACASSDPARRSHPAAPRPPGTRVILIRRRNPVPATPRPSS